MYIYEKCMYRIGGLVEDDKP